MPQEPRRKRATRDNALKATQTLSMISTPNGAILTGEVKKYMTYQEMVTDPQPMRLASVSNASMDTDYAVPEDHKGGVLYQYDAVNANWLLLYTTKDLMSGLYIDWNQIMNVPLWVGGVSNNRVRLNANKYATTRTTYFSYGDYILILPDPNDVSLGDQIVLEQYSGRGTICIPLTTQIAGGVHLNQVDPSLGSKGLYTVTRTDSESSVLPNIDEFKTVFSYVCTEDLMGNRVWARVNHTTLEETIASVRNDFDQHLVADDPHPQYLKRADIGGYLENIVVPSYDLPEATQHTLGGVYVATARDVTGNVGGVKAVTATVLHDLLEGYSVNNHNHPLVGLEDVSGTPTNGQALLWNATGQYWAPTTLTANNANYGDATHQSHGLAVLASMANFTNKDDNHYVVNGKLLADVLSSYRLKNDYPYIVQLKDVNIGTLHDGDMLVVRQGKVVQEEPPLASTLDAGYILIAKDSDIGPLTVVNDKAVTPVQLWMVMNILSSSIQESLDLNTYTLPAATVNELGGVKLIRDNLLDVIVENYGTDSQVITVSETAINPMQLAYYVRGLKNDIQTVTTALTNAINANQDDQDAIRAAIEHPTTGLAANWADHTTIVNGLTAQIAALDERISDDLTSNWADQRSLRDDVESVQVDLVRNWDDHADIAAGIDEKISDVRSDLMIDLEMPLYSVLLWYGDKNLVGAKRTISGTIIDGQIVTNTEYVKGSLYQWRICDGKIYTLRNKWTHETITVKTPNMKNRFPMGAETTAGVFYRDGLPNLKGEGQGLRGFVTDGAKKWTTKQTGVFRKGSTLNSAGIDSDGRLVSYGLRLDATLGSYDPGGNEMTPTESPFGKSRTVRPPSVSFFYVIKLEDSEWEIESEVAGIEAESPVIMELTNGVSINNGQGYQLSATYAGTEPGRLVFTKGGNWELPPSIELTSDGLISGVYSNWLQEPISASVDVAYISGTTTISTESISLVVDILDRIAGSSAWTITGNTSSSMSAILKYSAHSGTVFSTEGLPDSINGFVVTTATSSSYTSSILTIMFKGKPQIAGRSQQSFTIKGTRCSDKEVSIDWKIGPYYVEFPDETNTITVTAFTGESSVQEIRPFFSATNDSAITFGYKNASQSSLNVPNVFSATSTGQFTISAAAAFSSSYALYAKAKNATTAVGTLTVVVRSHYIIIENDGESYDVGYQADSETSQPDFFIPLSFSATNGETNITCGVQDTPGMPQGLVTLEGSVGSYRLRVSPSVLDSAIPGGIYRIEISASGPGGISGSGVITINVLSSGS